METQNQRIALVTGGSRGIGAATALALAARGYDVVITYRNKAARANEVAATIALQGVRSLAVCCDMTQHTEREELFALLKTWCTHLDLLVLNASGGLEADLVAADPHYPMHINRDAQVAMLNEALPLLARGSSVVFVTSHWAHLYGRIEQLPAYAPVGESKYAGEQALRERQEELATRGIRLLVVTGDLVEGTITPKLLERTSPGLAEHRRDRTGHLPTTQEMGEAIAKAAMDEQLESGHTVVVGGTLESMLE